MHETEEQVAGDIWLAMAGQTYRLEAAVLWHVDDFLGTWSCQIAGIGRIARFNSVRVS